MGEKCLKIISRSSANWPSWMTMLRTLYRM